ncbi:MAG TPA: hypothetical protein VMP42_05705 [Actinomycetota bacterium]|nr:hypothetical protein [Actinomycetota bacterium]
MKGRPSLALVAGSKRSIVFPLLPETLVRSRTEDPSMERLELVAHLDDRLEHGSATTAETISALGALGDEVSELRWGNRRFPGRIAGVTVTETAFREDLEPIAATIHLAFEVVPAGRQAVSVTVAGEAWRQVADLGRAGPDDRVYELNVDEDGSLQVRFGHGRRGARPPSGEVVVRASYRVGAGKAGR